MARRQAPGWIHAGAASGYTSHGPTQIKQQGIFPPEVCKAAKARLPFNYQKFLSESSCSIADYTFPLLPQCV